MCIDNVVIIVCVTLSINSKWMLRVHGMCVCVCVSFDFVKEVYVMFFDIYYISMVLLRSASVEVSPV
jgi:hypothetical protein